MASLNVEAYLRHALTQDYPSLAHVDPANTTSSRDMSPLQLLEVSASTAYYPGISHGMAYGSWGRVWIFYQQFRQCTLQQRCIVAWRQGVLDGIAQGCVDGNVLTAAGRLEHPERKLLCLSDAAD